MRLIFERGLSARHIRAVALAPGRPVLDDRLFGWFNRNGHRLYISTITIAETEQGICELRRNGGDMRAGLLSQWLDALIESGIERILPLDVEVGRFADKLFDKTLTAGHHPGFADVAVVLAGIGAARCYRRQAIATSSIEL